MNNSAICVYQLYHSHRFGDDISLVWSHSDDLDELDLMVSAPTDFELGREDEHVVLERLPGFLQDAINNSATECAEHVVADLPSFQKADPADRARLIESLPSEAEEKYGLDCAAADGNFSDPIKAWSPA